jgi:hypothetical protein
LATRKELDRCISSTVNGFIDIDFIALYQNENSLMVIEVIKLLLFDVGKVGWGRG